MPSNPVHHPLVSPQQPGSNQGYPVDKGGKKFAVTVLGANGELGNTLSLLFKIHPMIKRLHLFDVNDTEGMTLDLKHINTYPVVDSFHGNDFTQLKESLSKTDIVVILSSSSIRPDIPQEQRAKINMGLVRHIMTGIAEVCPKAFVAICADPINSTTPLAVELMRMHGIRDSEKRIFGVTTLDVVRACSFASERMGIPRDFVTVPVVVGHSKETLVPLTSQASVPINWSDIEKDVFTKRIRNTEDRINKTNKGKGGAVSSVAYSIYHFVGSLLMALSGKPAVECTYVRTDVQKSRYFSSPVMIDQRGVSIVYGAGEMEEYEEEQVRAALIILKQDIEIGENFARKGSST